MAFWLSVMCSTEASLPFFPLLNCSCSPCLSVPVSPSVSFSLHHAEFSQATGNSVKCGCSVKATLICGSRSSQGCSARWKTDSGKVRKECPCVVSSSEARCTTLRALVTCSVPRGSLRTLRKSISARQVTKTTRIAIKVRLRGRRDAFPVSHRLML